MRCRRCRIRGQRGLLYYVCCRCRAGCGRRRRHRLDPAYRSSRSVSGPEVTLLQTSFARAPASRMSGRGAPSRSLPPPGLGPYPARSGGRKSDACTVRPSPPTLAPPTVLPRPHRGAGPGHAGRPSPQRPSFRRSTRLPIVDGSSSRPTRTSAMIKTRRHANALASTHRHGPLPGQHSNFGAPTEHQSPTSWKIAAHPGTQSRPQPALWLVTALITKCARRDSNP